MVTQNATDTLRSRMPAALITFHSSLFTPTEFPSPQHSEPVEGVGAVFLNGHRHTDHHPAGGLLRRDADWLVGVDAGQAADVGDVGASVVLARRCLARDNASDGVQPIFVVVRAGEQIESGSPTPFQTFELNKGAVILHLCHTFPLVHPRPADIQWIIVSDSSW